MGKLNLDVAVPSSKEWIGAVMSDFSAFLQDHADCERKASAMAMSFVAKYPDRLEIIPELIDTAIEELEHFQQVYDLMKNRGIQLAHSIKEDPYVKELLRRCHSGRLERFLDRLLVASVVETRGAERFKWSRMLRMIRNCIVFINYYGLLKPSTVTFLSKWLSIIFRKSRSTKDYDGGLSRKEK